MHVTCLLSRKQRLGTHEFDSRVGPWEYGVGGPVLRVIRSLYDRSRSLVCIAGSKSVLFPVHVGLQLDCPFPPVPFIIFMDRISMCSQGLERDRVGCHRISSLRFGDDVVLLAGQGLQHALGSLQPGVKQLR